MDEVVALLRFLHLEHGRVEGGHAEEDGGAVAVYHLEHGLRRGPVREEHALGAHPHGEIHVVAEAVGEEELGRRECPVRRGDAQHLESVGVGADHHVALQVNGALGKSGGPGRVEPEAGIVPEVSSASSEDEALASHASKPIWPAPGLPTTTTCLR